MASAYGHRREYRDWVNPYDVQMMNQVASYKQQLHNANFDKIQQMIDQYGSMDLAKDVDKAYLYSRLETLTNKANSLGTMNLASRGVSGELENIIKQSVDDKVMNAYQGTQLYRADMARLKELEKLGEKGGYHINNAREAMESPNAWLNDGQVGSTYTGMNYKSYINVQEKYWDKLKELYKDMDGEFDVPLIGEDGKAVPGGMVRKKIRGMNSAEIRNIVENMMTPDEQDQLRIDAKWNMVMGKDPSMVVSLFQNSIDSRIDAYKAQLSKLPKSQTDSAAILKSNIQQLEALKTNSALTGDGSKEDLNKVIGMATYLNKAQLLQGLDDAFNKKVIGEKLIENPIYWKDQENKRGWANIRLREEELALKKKEKEEKDAEKKAQENMNAPFRSAEAIGADKVNEVAEAMSKKEGTLWNETYDTANAAFKSALDKGIFTQQDLEDMENSLKSAGNYDSKTLRYEAVKLLLEKRNYKSPEVDAFKAKYSERMDFVGKAHDVLKQNVSELDVFLTKDVSQPDFTSSVGKYEDFKDDPAKLKQAKIDRIMSLIVQQRLSKTEIEAAIAYYSSDGGKKPIPSRGEINNFMNILEARLSWDELTPQQKKLFNSNGFNKFYDAYKNHYDSNRWGEFGNTVLIGTSSGAMGGAAIGSFFGGVGALPGAKIGAIAGGIAGIVRGGIKDYQGEHINKSDESEYKGSLEARYRDLNTDTNGGVVLTYSPFHTNDDRKSEEYHAIANVLSYALSSEGFAAVEGDVDKISKLIKDPTDKKGVGDFISDKATSVKKVRDGKFIRLTFGGDGYIDVPTVEVVNNIHGDTGTSRVYQEWVDAGKYIGKRESLRSLSQSVNIGTLENYEASNNYTPEEKSYQRSKYQGTIDTSQWAKSFQPLVGNDSQLNEAIKKIALGNFGGTLQTDPTEADGIPVQNFRMVKNGKVLLQTNVRVETPLGQEEVARRLATGLDDGANYYIYLMLEDNLMRGNKEAILELAKQYQ